MKRNLHMFIAIFIFLNFCYVPKVQASSTAPSLSAPLELLKLRDIANLTPQGKVMNQFFTMQETFEEFNRKVQSSGGIDAYREQLKKENPWLYRQVDSEYLSDLWGVMSDRAKQFYSAIFNNTEIINDSELKDAVARIKQTSQITSSDLQKYGDYTKIAAKSTYEYFEQEKSFEQVVRETLPYGCTSPFVFIRQDNLATYYFDDLLFRYRISPFRVEYIYYDSGNKLGAAYDSVTSFYQSRSTFASLLSSLGLTFKSTWDFPDFGFLQSVPNGVYSFNGAVAGRLTTFPIPDIPISVEPDDRVKVPAYPVNFPIDVPVAQSEDRSISVGDVKINEDGSISAPTSPTDEVITGWGWLDSILSGIKSILQSILDALKNFFAPIAFSPVDFQTNLKNRFGYVPLENSLKRFQNMKTERGSAPVIRFNLYKLYQASTSHWDNVEGVNDYFPDNPYDDKDVVIIDFAVLEKIGFGGMNFPTWIRTFIGFGFIYTTAMYVYKKLTSKETVG